MEWVRVKTYKDCYDLWQVEVVEVSKDNHVEKVGNRLSAKLGGFFHSAFTPGFLSRREARGALRAYKKYLSCNSNINLEVKGGLH